MDIILKGESEKGLSVYISKEHLDLFRSQLLILSNSKQLMEKYMENAYKFNKCLIYKYKIIHLVLQHIIYY